MSSVRRRRKASANLGIQPQSVAKVLRQIAELDDPRDRDKTLTGVLAGHWRYRIGDFRVIARIEDGRMMIIVIAIGHRREVYR